MTKKQKIILVLLALLPLSIYVVWGVIKINYEGGTPINLVLFSLDNGFSDVLAWILAVILPLCLCVNLGIISKSLSVKKRIFVPLILCVTVIAINFVVIRHILHQRINSDNIYKGSCQTILINGHSESSCLDEN